ncbi:MAG TPA: YceI family protein [Myxococcaceae bacterium]|jgi:polyisoprenoid-binding protein YceI|nr:YceI family protein [Myxococcaceae bacterium]
MRIAIATFAVLAVPLSAGASDWQFDSAHTSAQFAVRHLMVSTVRGAFSGITGTASFDEKDLGKSSVQVSIPAASVDTREPKRDTHLKSSDFLDVEKFPSITFKSTKVSAHPTEGSFQVEGNLTIHGVTKPVVLQVEMTPELKGPGGAPRRGVSASTKINRKDFGLVWNRSLEAGGVMVGDDVSIQIDAELVQPKA